MGLTKEQYAGILDKRLSKEESEMYKKAQRSPEYRKLQNQIKNLEKEKRVLLNKQKRVVPSKSYQERQAEISKFRQEWDNMLLILNNKRRDEEKMMILKKYKLFR